MQRRRFLEIAGTGGTLAWLGDLGFLARLPPVSSADARLDSRLVRLAPEIEPLVRLVEETPREQVLEEVAARIRRGLSYREVVAALLLAGVRNIQPRPVGFKFHAVLVVNSAHLASLASPEADRWLPIFWAIDQFKSSQAADVRQGDWSLGPVDESAVPPQHRARQAFIDAMDAWDEAGCRRRDRRAGPFGASGRVVRDPRALRRARLPRDRTQGDLRRQQLPHAGGHRLATRRAGLALARLRAARP